MRFESNNLCVVHVVPVLFIGASLFLTLLSGEAQEPSDICLPRRHQEQQRQRTLQGDEGWHCIVLRLEGMDKKTDGMDTIRSNQHLNFRSPFFSEWLMNNEPQMRSVKNVEFAM